MKRSFVFAVDSVVVVLAPEVEVEVVEQHQIHSEFVEVPRP